MKTTIFPKTYMYLIGRILSQAAHFFSEGLEDLVQRESEHSPGRCYIYPVYHYLNIQNLLRIRNRISKFVTLKWW